MPARVGGQGPSRSRYGGRLMAPDWRESGIVFFTVSGDPEVYFARRFADGRFWAANRWRGWRVMGLGCRRLKPILISGSGDRQRIHLVDPVEVWGGAA